MGTSPLQIKFKVVLKTKKGRPTDVPDFYVLLILKFNPPLLPLDDELLGIEAEI